MAFDKGTIQVPRRAAKVGPEYHRLRASPSGDRNSTRLTPAKAATGTKEIFDEWNPVSFRKGLKISTISL